MKFLVKHPTRGCPERFGQTANQWLRRTSGVNRVHFQFTIDVDDQPSIEEAEKLRAHPEITNGKNTLEILVVPSRGKIAACNAGIQLDTGGGWDVVILASDDFTPEVFGWDETIRRAMQWHFPALDGFLHFPDAYTAYERFATIPVMGVNLWRRWGYIYHPDYKSLWCDREQTEVVGALRKNQFIDLPIFQHRHRGQTPDETYNRNNLFWKQDEETYKRRKKAGFGIRQPDLSILVCALDSRRHFSDVLLPQIYKQIFSLADHNRVELHVLLDQKRFTVGAKRNILMSRARGKFSCFIDDDDRIAPDYVASVLKAIDGVARADCVVFNGQFSMDGANLLKFDYDLKYRAYRNTATLYERTPNHLCPIRTDLACKIKFPEQNKNEDTEFARRIRPLLRTQAVCCNSDGSKKTLYFYDFSSTGTETQKLKAA
ncbi:MAG TPA: glycosyltransferase family A protein [Phycisphaerae bacterium]|nr:glycosyltransferase family A protein [Phycisphaerae bacterium]